MARRTKTNAAVQLGLPTDYVEFLESLKARVQQSQTKAMLSVNRELIAMYWDIGRQIVERQEREGWGKSVVDRLAVDLQKAFPGLGGFSPRNVWRMRTFYLAYQKPPEVVPQPVGQLPFVSKVAQAVRQNAGPISAQPVPKSKRQTLAQAAREMAEPVPSQAVTELNFAILPQAVAEIPWGHNVWILEKVKDLTQRLWYATKTLEHDWSRAILTVQDRKRSLRPPGEGGQQLHLMVGEDDFYIDLLFYHLKLRCFVVIDLKMKKFTPEDAGKMNFYLSAVDSQMRHPDDAPSIGLVLCKTRDRITAEYALRDIAKPIGVAEWQTKLVHSLPEPLKSSLPSIQEIEAEFELVPDGASGKPGLPAASADPSPQRRTSRKASK